MQDQLSKAERYRKEAAKYHERAKLAEPAYLGDFFRQCPLHVHGPGSVEPATRRRETAPV